MPRFASACLVMFALVGCRTTTSPPVPPVTHLAQPDAGPWAGISFACRSSDAGGSLAFLNDSPLALRVAGAASARGLRPLAWSADGQWLALEGAPDGGGARVYLLRGLDEEPLPLAPGEAYGEGRYRFLKLSPVGSRAALVDAGSQVWLWEEARPARVVGRIIPPGHAEWARLDTGQVAFSPDGRWLAWIAPDRRVAYLDTADGSAATLTEVAADRMVWSPDSRAVLTYEEHEVPFSEGACYGVLHLPAGRWTKLMDAPAAFSWELRDGARWSPDGSLVALNLARTSMGASTFEPAGPTHRSEIVVFDAAGGIRATLALGAAQRQGVQPVAYSATPLVWQFVWHPDGRSLLTWEQGGIVRRPIERPQEAAPLAEGLQLSYFHDDTRCVVGSTEAALVFADLGTGRVIPWPHDVPLPKRGDCRGTCARQGDACGERVLCCVAAREAEPGGGLLTTQEWYLWEPAREAMRHLDFAAAQTGVAHPFPKPHEVTWFLDGRRLLLKRGENIAAARSGPCRVAVFHLDSGQVTPVPGVAESWVSRPTAVTRS